MLKVSKNYSKNIPDEYIPKKKVGTYWEGTGRYQEQFIKLRDTMEERCHSLDLSLQLDRDEIPDWMFLMKCIYELYFIKYYDGSNAREAIVKHQICGFKTVESFKEFCKKMGAHSAIRYLEHSSVSNLEKAMDEVIIKLG